jgi:hypothetical protein
MDAFDNDHNHVNMTLEDARVVLQHFLSLGTFHDACMETVLGYNLMFFYDQAMLYSEHAYYDYVLDGLNRMAFEDFMDDEARAEDGRFVAEIGAWVVAMNTVNRALPVTLEHARVCRVGTNDLVAAGLCNAMISADPDGFHSGHALGTLLDLIVPLHQDGPEADALFGTFHDGDPKPSDTNFRS